jgi:hypothetical protein
MFFGSAIGKPNLVTTRRGDKDGPAPAGSAGPTKKAGQLSGLDGSGQADAAEDGRTTN